MDVSFLSFWNAMTTSPILAIAIILTLGVIFVNGVDRCAKRYRHLCHDPVSRRAHRYLDERPI